MPYGYDGCTGQRNRKENSTAGAAKVFFTGIHYAAPYDFITGEIVNLSNKHVVLVCGIARPEPLQAFLKKNAAEVHTLSYKDHHYFVTADLEEIKTAYDNWNFPDKIIVTTEK